MTGNQLTVTGVYSTDEPKYAYGGGNEGAMGDVTRNTVTIDLVHAADSWRRSTAAWRVPRTTRAQSTTTPPP